MNSERLRINSLCVLWATALREPSLFTKKRSAIFPSTNIFFFHAKNAKIYFSKGRKSEELHFDTLRNLRGESLFTKKRRTIFPSMNNFYLLAKGAENFSRKERKVREKMRSVRGSKGKPAAAQTLFLTCF